MSTKAQPTEYERIFKPMQKLDIHKVTRKENIDCRNEMCKRRERRARRGIFGSLERQRSSWFGDLVAGNDGRQTKRVREIKSMYNRGRGRPKRSWVDVSAEDPRKRNVGWVEARKLAPNKTR